VQDKTIQVAGTDRTYVLAVPDSYDPGTPLPLVFAWHGAGGDGKLARLYFGVEQASNGGAIFVYPDGLEVNGATGWDLAIDGPDVSLFDAIVGETTQTYCIDPARVFSTGHSFGGFFTNSLGCARANVLRAIAPVSGGGPFSNNCSGALAAWLTHGTADTTVPFTNGEDSRDHWLAADGCAASTQATNPPPCVAYDGCQAGTAVHWCAHDGGHEWPSFAADAIWDFFASAP
jgi:poly(3-hydroxybutyrate) depolymerase